MDPQKTSLLFAGDPQPFGGLTNELELAEQCPIEFKEENPWSDYANRVFIRGADTTTWKWKTDDEVTQVKQLVYLDRLLGTFGLSHEDKEAVASWMLSEMLTELPE